ncbi:TPA: hypothetical protein DCZ39_01710 [Patescibacteria group bacterium]|nr:hypothetical protein [Candidatus Gracilibacteria bacterium]
MTSLVLFVHISIEGCASTGAGLGLAIEGAFCTSRFAGVRVILNVHPDKLVVSNTNPTMYTFFIVVFEISKKSSE